MLLGIKLIRICIVLSAPILSGCATQGSYVPVGSNAYQARPVDFPVEIFIDSILPDRPYKEIAELDVHYEQTHFLSVSQKRAFKDLKIQARDAGADAIIKIDETRTNHTLETMVYHVNAIAIIYTDK